MAPSAKTSNIASVKIENMGGISTSRWSNSREATPSAVKVEKSAANKDTELASAFKTDLTDIRNLVTCSICDQLLYEPWTLSCGHTYCYSCLCSWFVPNKKKKTCPECRTSIKQMPAPAFLVKQMVEIFCKRGEIMPNDESVDQHKSKRAEELADVDKDKNSAEGLFKGTFIIKPAAELLYDQADGVLRCPGCHHEHEGGPLCNNCGIYFEGHHDDDQSYAFSDSDGLEVDDELELDEMEFGGDGAYDHLDNIVGPLPHLHHFPLGPGHAHFHRHHHHYDESLGESSGNESSVGSEAEEDDEDEDEGSLQDFVVGDEADEDVNHRPRVRAIVNISDDESDEGGPIIDRRATRRQVIPSSSPNAPSYLSITDSENGDTNAELLRVAGWSSLDEGDDDDDDLPIGHAGNESEDISGDESDTNTMRNEASDDEDDTSRDDMSETPTYMYNGERYLANPGSPNSYESDDNSEAGYHHTMDRDGDTEMSASPGPSVLSRGGSVDPRYGLDDFDGEGTPRGQREMGISTDRFSGEGEYLGLTNRAPKIEIESDSSDTSVQPPRRRPRQFRNVRVQQTDPRISMMFAEHQLSLRGAEHNQNDLDEFAIENARAEPAARTRRMTSYRIQPSRRAELRNSQTSSATRVISSTSRAARPPRQYQRRYH